MSRRTWRKPRMGGAWQRRPHHAPPGPRGRPTHPQAHRDSAWLGQDGHRPAQGAPSWNAQDRLAVHVRLGRLKPRPPTGTSDSRTMTSEVCPAWSRRSQDRDVSGRGRPSETPETATSDKKPPAILTLANSLQEASPSALQARRTKYSKDRRQRACPNRITAPCFRGVPKSALRRDSFPDPGQAT